MSEIEKLYSNIGVKTCKHKQGFTLNDCTNRDCKECGCYIIPPFTAEKVLEVIVFFLNKGIRLEFSVEENTKISVENFKECIAQIGAKYWQSLTEEERKQIKEILE